MASHPADNATQPNLDSPVDPVNEGSPKAPQRSRDLHHPECREDLRVPYYLETTLYGERQFTCGLVINLSLGGMFIECYEFLALDEKVKVDLELPGGKLWCEGRIAWFREGLPSGEGSGMGVQFVDLTEEEVTLVRNAIEIALDAA